MCNPPLLSHFDALSSPSSSASHFTGRKVRRSYYRPMNKNDHGDEYFLNSCFLCKTHLHPNDDVYMYRGDVAFCSEECRQDQIDIDEAREKKWTKEKMLKQAKTTSKYQEIRVRAAGTVIA